MTKNVRLILGLLLAWFLAHAIFLIIDGSRDKLGRCDVGVILGNTVELNGQPSMRLKVRLDRGVELFRNGYFKSIIVSGGLGKEGFYEARVMRKYLIDKGIAPKAIIMDDQGMNTMETAVNTRSIMNRRRLRSAMIITQYYHITRTKLAFRRSDIGPLYWAHAKTYLDLREIYSIPREVVGYYAYLLK